MKIYQILKKRDRRTERHAMLAEVSGLKQAAGGEDIVILSDEAVNSYRRDNSAKNRQQQLVKLALQHINDHNPELEDLQNDPEFMKAEKLVLLAELAIRVASSAKSRNTYEWVTDFVIEQLQIKKP